MNTSLNVQDLLNNGHQYSFFQAVRLLRAYLKSKNLDWRTHIHMRPARSLVFPAADIQKISLEDTEKYMIELNFLGLYGVDSPLPSHLSLAALVPEEDIPWRDFLDIFHHQLYLLYWRAWYCGSITTQLSDGDNHFYKWLANISQQRFNPTDKELIGLSSFLTKRQVNLTSLRDMVSYLVNGVSVDVQGFQLQWLETDKSAQCQLASGVAIKEKQILGKRMLDASYGILLTVSNVSMPRFLELIPGEPLAQLLGQLLKTYLYPFYDVTVKIVVHTESMDLSLGNRQLKLAWLCPLGRMPESKTQTFYFSGKRYGCSGAL